MNYVAMENYWGIKKPPPYRRGLGLLTIAVFANYP